MSLELYTAALKSFEWDFEYSDDFRVWHKWSIAKRDLLRMQELYDENFILWNSYAPKEFRIIQNKA